MSIETKDEIIAAINDYVAVLPPYIANVDAHKINKSHNGKWSIAENAEHLIRSVQPINLALSLPKLSFILFGRTKHARDYDTIVNLYHSVLKNGGKASLPFTPKPTFSKRSGPKVAMAWKEAYSTCAKRIEHWSEEELDKYCLPHPLLGKVTMREMLFFTVHHIEHHFNSIKQQNENE